MGDENKKEVFIGAKPLSEAQVKITVPTYDYILTQIDEIRDNASKSNKDISREYNNTFGLFGERGTGKTSAIKTIIKQLKSDSSNIILPIIEPDNFGENTKILGAILNGFKKEVESISKYIKSNTGSNEKFHGYFENCIFKEKNPLSIAYDKVIEFYCYKEDEYRKLLTKDYTDMSTYKKKMEYILNPDMEFKNKFSEFINELIRVIKDINCEKEPLIFLFIDDVDLKTQKCKELIESVMQYTCHPNLVCFLSGDYEILKESITIGLLEGEKIIKSIGLNYRSFNSIFSKEENSTNLFNRKKYLANEYLKKVLPPAFRHNVVKWNEKSIPNFTFIDEKDNKEFLYEKLIQLFGEKNIFTCNILDDDGEKTKLNIESSYKIFDKTPRGLVNVYYYLSRFEKEKFKEDIEYRFIYIKSLIDTIINSSSKLINHQKEFFDNYLKWGNDEKTTGINFGFNLDENRTNNKENDEIIELCYFLLGHCVKELLPGLVYVESSYNKAKKTYIDKFKNKSVDIGIVTNAINDISLNSELKFSLAFFQVLKNRNFNYKQYNKENIIFKTVYNLIIDDEYEKDNNSKAIKILEHWYRLKYSDSTGKMKNILELLDTNCRIANNYEETEIIFKKLSILSKYDNVELKIPLDKHSDLIYFMQNPESPKINPSRWTIKNINEYIYPILINTLCKITEISEDVKIEDSSKKKLYNSLININAGKVEDRKKTKAIKYIEENIGITDKLNHIAINDYSIQLELKTINIDGENKIDASSKLGEFIYKGSTFNKKTIYRRSSQFITNLFSEYFYLKDNENYIYNDKLITNKLEKKYISFDLGAYILLVKKLKYLAYETNAWYGVQAARDLLEELQTKAEISEEFISMDDKLILSQYKKYREDINEDIKVEKNNDEKRRLMKYLLKTSLNNVQEETKNDIQDLGLDLEDDERDLDIEA